jgi:hypothetical protein
MIKELLELKDKYIENIKFKDIEIEKNLNKKQIICLKMFLKKQPFRVVICDKNVGWAIIDHDLYYNISYVFSYSI